MRRVFCCGRTIPETQATNRSASRRLSHSPIWFQLAKVWLTSLRSDFRRRLSAIAAMRSRRRGADLTNLPSCGWQALQTQVAGVDESRDARSGVRARSRRGDLRRGGLPVVFTCLVVNDLKHALVQERDADQRARRGLTRVGYPRTRTGIQRRVAFVRRRGEWYIEADHTAAAVTPWKRALKAHPQSHAERPRRAGLTDKT